MAASVVSGVGPVPARDAHPPDSRRSVRLAARLYPREHLGTTLSPWIELVRRRTRAPSLARRIRLAGEPVGASQLVRRLEKVRAEREALSKECLRVLVHLALEIHEPEIVVRVQRRLRIVVQPD